MIPRLGHHLGRGSVAVTVHRRTGPVHRLAVHPGSATSIPPSNPGGLSFPQEPHSPVSLSASINEPLSSQNFRERIPHGQQNISLNFWPGVADCVLDSMESVLQGLDRNFPNRRSVPNSSWKLRLTRWFRQHAPGRGPQLVCIPINILRRTGNRPP
jgi:hypothetical protein